jgi:hypothetical protein
MSHYEQRREPTLRAAWLIETERHRGSVMSVVSSSELTSLTTMHSRGLMPKCQSSASVALWLVACGAVTRGTTDS